MTTSATPMNGNHPLTGTVIALVLSAMAIFAYTIAVGILNGLDLVDFSRQLLLAHLHGGTLGWMTLGIMAATFWLFAGASSSPSLRSLQQARWLAVFAVAAIALYVATFATTFGIARPLAGTVTLLSLVGIGIWALSRTPSLTLTVPRVFVILGLATSVIGGAFGVLNGFAIARGWTWVPESFFDAHPGTMEVGFIIPVAMGLAEWGLRRNLPEEHVTRAGKFQVGFMFAAFAWVLTMTLAEQEELIGPGIGLAIVGLVIFYVRMWPLARKVSFLERSPDRHGVMAGIFLGVAIVYVFVILQMAEGVFDDIPRGQLLSFIHIMAIGGTTNALLAFVFYLSRQRLAPSVLDDVVFWGINIGVAGFVIALTSDVTGLIRVFVPLMGVALMVAIAIHAYALVVGEMSSSEEPLAAK